MADGDLPTEQGGVSQYRVQQVSLTRQAGGRVPQVWLWMQPPAFFCLLQASAHAAAWSKRCRSHQPKEAWCSFAVSSDLAQFCLQQLSAAPPCPNVHPARDELLSTAQHIYKFAHSLPSVVIASSCLVQWHLSAAAQLLVLCTWQQRLHCHNSRVELHQSAHLKLVGKEL